jgi:c(7)-type cytochrome triheme protein
MKRILVVPVLLLCSAAVPALASVGGGDITLKNKGGTVVFSHETHVSGAGRKCTACHDKLYTDARQHKKVSMKQMQKGKSCGSCHDGKSAFSVKGNCARCHKK